MLLCSMKFLKLEPWWAPDQPSAGQQQRALFLPLISSSFSSLFEHSSTISHRYMPGSLSWDSDGDVSTFSVPSSNNFKRSSTNFLSFLLTSASCRVATAVSILPSRTAVSTCLQGSPLYFSWCSPKCSQRPAECGWRSRNSSPQPAWDHQDCLGIHTSWLLGLPSPLANRAVLFTLLNLIRSRRLGRNRSPCSSSPRRPGWVPTWEPNVLFIFLPFEVCNHSFNILDTSRKTFLDILKCLQDVTVVEATANWGNSFSPTFWTSASTSIYESCHGLEIVILNTRH